MFSLSSGHYLSELPTEIIFRGNPKASEDRRPLSIKSAQRSTAVQQRGCESHAFHRLKISGLIISVWINLTPSGCKGVSPPVSAVAFWWCSTAVKPRPRCPMPPLLMEIAACLSSGESSCCAKYWLNYWLDFYHFISNTPEQTERKSVENRVNV